MTFGRVFITVLKGKRKGNIHRKTEREREGERERVQVCTSVWICSEDCIASPTHSTVTRP